MLDRKRFSRTLVMMMVGGLVAVAACKKKVEPPPPPPPQPVAVKLQISRINPGEIAPQSPTSGTIYGSAFADGASVAFVGAAGEVAGSEVMVRDSNTISVMVPGLDVGAYDVRVTNGGTGERSTLRSGLNVKLMELPCKFARVHFAFDDYGLNPPARGTLDGNMDCYQTASGQIQVDGYTDERGTIDYNLALGQRRADTVKGHLSKSGVASSRIRTTSYGEEKPLAMGHDEAAWAQNRRAEINANE